jgi:predicted Zn-dependent protease
MEKGTLGNLLLGTLLGRSSSTIKALGGLAANLVMMGYSRDDENDADKRAVRYMMRAGYDPNGLVRFFDLLNQKGGAGGGGMLTYFRTHPPTGDRIKRVQEEIAKNGGSSSGMAPPRAATARAQSGSVLRSISIGAATNPAKEPRPTSPGLFYELQQGGFARRTV